MVAPSGSGKTAALQDVESRTGAPLVNLNLEISRRMLELTEILSDMTLKQNALHLLRGVSLNRTVVAAWNGVLDNNYLTYATPEHPDHRRYRCRELVIVCQEVME